MVRILLLGLDLVEAVGCDSIQNRTALHSEPAGDCKNFVDVHSEPARVGPDDRAVAPIHRGDTPRLCMATRHGPEY